MNWDEFELTAGENFELIRVVRPWNTKTATVFKAITDFDEIHVSKDNQLLMTIPFTINNLDEFEFLRLLPKEIFFNLAAYESSYYIVLEEIENYLEFFTNFDIQDAIEHQEKIDDLYEPFDGAEFRHHAKAVGAFQNVHAWVNRRKLISVPANGFAIQILDGRSDQFMVNSIASYELLTEGDKSFKSWLYSGNGRYYMKTKNRNIQEEATTFFVFTDHRLDRALATWIQYFSENFSIYKPVFRKESFKNLCAHLSKIIAAHGLDFEKEYESFYVGRKQIAVHEAFRIESEFRGSEDCNSRYLSWLLSKRFDQFIDALTDYHFVLLRDEHAEPAFGVEVGKVKTLSDESCRLYEFKKDKTAISDWMSFSDLLTKLEKVNAWLYVDYSPGGKKKLVRRIEKGFFELRSVT